MDENHLYISVCDVLDAVLACRLHAAIAWKVIDEVGSVLWASPRKASPRNERPLGMGATNQVGRQYVLVASVEFLRVGEESALEEDVNVSIETVRGWVGCCLSYHASIIELNDSADVGTASVGGVVAETIHLGAGKKDRGV